MGHSSGGYANTTGLGRFGQNQINITCSNGQTLRWLNCCPRRKLAYLFREVTVLHDIKCHLAIAHLELAGEPWAVLSDQPPSLQTFALYGQRFGGIEPHFKDYKSAAFELIRSHLSRCFSAQLFVDTVGCSTLIAISIAVVVHRRATKVDRLQRGLSFLQFGLRAD